MANQKILLAQLYSNGDCLYATTVAKQIKQDFPGCHLTWAISSKFKSIIANNPDVDEILAIDTVEKNDTPAFRCFKRQIYQQQKEGVYDKTFVVHNSDTNHAFYDGSIRSSILKAYPFPITVSVQPVLRLYSNEIDNANSFAIEHLLKNYDHVILFEFAPQSGQSSMNEALAISIAEELVSTKRTAVILSSPNKIAHTNKAIIDGSKLTLRETAALSHHCSFLLGSSSGITWITTSEAGKLLPMVQLLNAATKWVNPISRDFERFNLNTEMVIEILKFDKRKIVECVDMALTDFKLAKEKFNQPIPLHFRTTRYIVYNLLCYFEFKAIVRHIQINTEVYGQRLSFYKEVVLGFITAPFRLIGNIIKKFSWRSFKKKCLLIKIRKGWFL